MSTSLLTSGELNLYTAIGEDGATVWQFADAFRNSIEHSVKLGKSCADILAIPKISRDLKQISWYVPFDNVKAGGYDIVNWNCASYDEKKAAVKVLKDFENRAEVLGRELSVTALSGNDRLFAHFLTGNHDGISLPAFHFPSTENLFIVDGKPVITFWGFKKNGDKPKGSPFAMLKLPDRQLTPSQEKVMSEHAGATSALSRFWWLLPLLLLLLLLLYWLWHKEFMGTEVAKDKIIAESHQPNAMVLKQNGSAENRFYGATDKPKGVYVHHDDDLGGVIVSAGDNVKSAVGKTANTTDLSSETSSKDDKALPLKGANHEAWEKSVKGDGFSLDGKENTLPNNETDLLAKGSNQDNLLSSASNQENKSNGDLQDTALKDGGSDPKRNALKLNAEDLRRNNLKQLDGTWQVRSSIVDSKTNLPLNLEYNFKDGKGLAVVSTQNGNKCQGEVQGKVQGGALHISNESVTSCSDGSSYNLPSVVCKPGKNGLAECVSSYSGSNGGRKSTFPMQLTK